jgi:hypothetical protein
MVILGVHFAVWSGYKRSRLARRARCIRGERLAILRIRSSLRTALCGWCGVARESGRIRRCVGWIAGAGVRSGGVGSAKGAFEGWNAATEAGLMARRAASRALEALGRRRKQQGLTAFRITVAWAHRERHHRLRASLLATARRKLCGAIFAIWSDARLRTLNIKRVLVSIDAESVADCFQFWRQDLRMREARREGEVLRGEFELRMKGRFVVAWRHAVESSKGTLLVELRFLRRRIRQVHE